MHRRAIHLLLFAAVASAQDQPVQTTTLANGMKVLVQEDHDIPNIAMYLFYKIGSRNEHSGITGLSHFFEHMMFNGAKKYGPKQFDIQLERAGGTNNAYTDRDLTAYTDFIPSSALELTFDLEADRIRDLALDPKIVESERGVVYSERRNSTDNNNARMLGEQLRAAAYTAHPYQWPVVGWPSDIESWSMEDLQSYFKMGYAPNNCVLVIVGDTSMAQVATLAKKYLEPISRRDPPPPVRTKEPEQLGERRVVVTKAAQQPLLMAAYHIPEAKHPDFNPLRVLAAILTSGQSSRLYTRLVDTEQAALSVGADADENVDPGLFIVNIQVRSGTGPARAEAILFEEIEKIQASAVGADELQRAKNQLLAGHYRSRKTIAERADMLGKYEVLFDGYARAFSAPQELSAVTAADLQRVAKKYLTAKNRTVATLIPEVKQ